MNNELIFDRFEKIMPKDYDQDYYFETLFKHPEGEWFFPNNSDGDGYTICMQMAAVHLVAHKCLPSWRDSSFQGVRHAFLYKKNLDYKNV